MTSDLVERRNVVKAKFEKLVFMSRFYSHYSSY